MLRVHVSREGAKRCLQVVGLLVALLQALFESGHLTPEAVQLSSSFDTHFFSCRRISVTHLQHMGTQPRQLLGRPTRFRCKRVRPTHCRVSSLSSRGSRIFCGSSGGVRCSFSSRCGAQRGCCSCLGRVDSPLKRCQDVWRRSCRRRSCCCRRLLRASSKRSCAVVLPCLPGVVSLKLCLAQRLP